MSPRSRFTLLLALLAIAAGALGGLPSEAAADADPPSDVLLTQNAYTPYTLTDQELNSALNQVADEANKKGYKIRVAVIGALNDLGSVPDFFDKPMPYARFLASELSFGRKNTRPLLTVQKAGFGYVNIGPERRVLAKIDIPSDADANTLTRIAIDAVPKLSTAAGFPIKPSNLAYSGSDGGGTSPALIVGIPVAVLALAGLVLAMRRTQSASEDEDEDEDEGEAEGEAGENEQTGQRDG
jgi:hypothetical protein